MAITKKTAVSIFVLLGTIQAGAAGSTPITVSLGQSLEIGFGFDNAFTGTPGVIRSGVKLENSGYDFYFSEVSLYDGTKLLSGPNTWSAGFPHAGGAVFAIQADFSSILDRTIDGRFVISPELFKLASGASVATSFTFDPSKNPIIVDVTNAGGTAIVGRGTVNTFSVIGTAYKPLVDFSSSIELSRVKNGFRTICCGAFGLAPIGPSTNTTSFDLEFGDGSITLSFDIGLYGDIPSSSLMNTWEKGIEEAWSKKYEIRDSYYAYPIVFDVNFEPGSRLTRTQEWVVEVHSETPDNSSEDTWWSTENWYSTLPLPDGADPACWGLDPMGRAAAHEFGHFLGLYDEYAGGKNGPFGVRTDGLMGSCIGKSVQDRYFEAILASINDLTGRDYVLGSLPGWVASDSVVPPGPGFHDSLSPGSDDTMHSQIPEPSSLFLIAGGFLLLYFSIGGASTRARPCGVLGLQAKHGQENPAGVCGDPG